MYLYHYIAKGNHVEDVGILSFAFNSKADLSYYHKRSGETTHQGIVNWMENCFSGRSRGVRCFSEPIQWTDKSLSLKTFTENADLYAIDVKLLLQDGLLEDIYVSPSVLDIPNVTQDNCLDEILIHLNTINEIDMTPIDWTVCNDELGYRFAFVRYYLLIIKGGIILPKYIKKINKD